MNATPPSPSTRPPAARAAPSGGQAATQPSFTLTAAGQTLAGHLLRPVLRDLRGEYGARRDGDGPRPTCHRHLRPVRQHGSTTDGLGRQHALASGSITPRRPRLRQHLVGLDCDASVGSATWRGPADLHVRAARPPRRTYNDQVHTKLQATTAAGGTPMTSTTTSPPATSSYGVRWQSDGDLRRPRPACLGRHWHHGHTVRFSSTRPSRRGPSAGSRRRRASRASRPIRPGASVPPTTTSGPTTFSDATTPPLGRRWTAANDVTASYGLFGGPAIRRRSTTAPLPTSGWT